MEINIKKGRAMGMHKLLDMAQIVGFFSMVLCILVGKHNETFMIINSSQCPKIEGRLVANIELRKPDKSRVER